MDKALIGWSAALAIVVGLVSGAIWWVHRTPSGGDTAPDTPPLPPAPEPNPSYPPSPAPTPTPAVQGSLDERKDMTVGGWAGFGGVNPYKDKEIYAVGATSVINGEPRVVKTIADGQKIGKGTGYMRDWTVGGVTYQMVEVISPPMASYGYVSIKHTKVV